MALPRFIVHKFSPLYLYLYGFVRKERKISVGARRDGFSLLALNLRPTLPIQIDYSMTVPLCDVKGNNSFFTWI
jgi:hypothetical protein